MEPFPNNAVAVEWEFRCNGKDNLESPWAWRCRSRDGAVIATSKGCFVSLTEAIADAKHHGFLYELPPPGRR